MSENKEEDSSVNALRVLKLEGTRDFGANTEPWNPDALNPLVVTLTFLFVSVLEKVGILPRTLLLFPVLCCGIVVYLIARSDRKNETIGRLYITAEDIAFTSTDRRTLRWNTTDIQSVRIKKTWKSNVRVCLSLQDAKAVFYLAEPIKRVRCIFAARENRIRSVGCCSPE